MTPMEGLKLFSRTSGGGLNLASFHSPHCMCWSWLISFNRFRPGEWRVRPIFWRHNDNTTRRWTIRIPFIGFIGWQRQIRPMPYRDLYRQLQDRLDKERYERPEPPIPRHRLTVIDGGQSLH